MNEQTAAPADAAPPPEEPTPEQALQAANDRIAALEAELAEMKERWMRSEAENANVRNRAKKDVDDTRQYAVQKFATDVVEAAENLKRGIDSLPPASPDQPAIVAKVREGLEGVERSFISTLERNGIKPRGPGRPAVRPQPAPGDGRTGKRNPPARHGASRRGPRRGPCTAACCAPRWSSSPRPRPRNSPGRRTVNVRILRSAYHVNAGDSGRHPKVRHCDRMERKIRL